MKQHLRKRYTVITLQLFLALAFVSTTFATSAQNAEKVTANGIHPSEFRSLDLQTFGLYGHPCKCRYTKGGKDNLGKIAQVVSNRKLQCLEFDREGRLTRVDNCHITYKADGSSTATCTMYDGEQEFYAPNSAIYGNRDKVINEISYDYERNEQGQIRCTGHWNHRFMVTYNEKGDVSHFSYCPDGSYFMIDSIACVDKHSWPETVCLNYGDYGNLDEPYFKGTVSYKYTKIDRHGNWTERKATLRGWYVDETLVNLPDYDYEASREFVEMTYTDHRKISYYK